MKNKAAAELGSLGGRARAARLTPDELRRIAMMGVAARRQWRHDKKSIMDCLEIIERDINLSGKIVEIYLIGGVVKWAYQGTEQALALAQDHADKSVGAYIQPITLAELLEDIDSVSHGTT